MGCPLEDLEVEVLAVVEREPLLLQTLQLLDVAHLVLPNGRLGQRVVLEVLFQLLVDLTVRGRGLVGREGRRLYGPHAAKTTITILLSSFVLFERHLLVVYAVVPRVHRLDPLLLPAPLQRGKALAEVPTVMRSLLGPHLLYHRNQVVDLGGLRPLGLHH